MDFIRGRVKLYMQIKVMTFNEDLFTKESSLLTLSVS